MTVSIKRGDTLPAVSVACLIDGAPVDLSAATAVKIVGRLDDELVIERVVPGPSDGVVVINWLESETAQIGRLRIEIEVTWPDAKIQTWPGSGAVNVRIRPDLNPPM